MQSGPFICFHNRFVFLIALLLSEIGLLIKTKQNKQKQCRSWSGKDGGAFAGPICYSWDFFFFNVIPVPKGTNSVLCLGFVNTGWRGLIKNTFQKGPCSLTQNFHCLLLTQSCAAPPSRSFYHFIISSQMLIWSISCLSVSQSLEVISVLWLLKYKVSLLHFHHFNTSSIVSSLFFLLTRPLDIFKSTA